MDYSSKSSTVSDSLTYYTGSERPPQYSINPNLSLSCEPPPPPPGYQSYPVQMPPPGYQSYPVQTPPPGYQSYPVQTAPRPASNYGATTVVVSQPSIIIVGGCPACRVGVLEDDYTCLGIFCAIFFFPVGILCCLALKDKRCSNCGAYFG